MINPFHAKKESFCLLIAMIAGYVLQIVEDNVIAKLGKSCGLNYKMQRLYSRQAAFFAVAGIDLL